MRPCYPTRSSLFIFSVLEGLPDPSLSHVNSRPRGDRAKSPLRRGSKGSPALPPFHACHPWPWAPSFPAHDAPGARGSPAIWWVPAGWAADAAALSLAAAPLQRAWLQNKGGRERTVEADGVMTRASNMSLHAG